MKTQLLEGRPANITERDFYDAAKAAGWSATKRGWPDFFMDRNGEIACVEVKPTKNKALKREQAKILQALAAYGIPCYRWSPDEGFTRIR